MQLHYWFLAMAEYEVPVCFFWFVLTVQPESEIPPSWGFLSPVRVMHILSSSFGTTCNNPILYMILFPSYCCLNFEPYFMWFLNLSID